MSQDYPFVPGLVGVPAGKTRICTVGPKGHGLTYRGYSLDDLVLNGTFEEVAYLITRGKLPSKDELVSYKKKINGLFELPGVIRRLLELIPKNSHPMDVLKSVTSLLGCLDKTSNVNGKLDNPIDIGDKLLAIFPSAIAYHYRYHFFNEIIETKGLNNEGIGEHFLRLLHNNNNLNNSDYGKLMNRCMDVSLICYAEHGFCASTFACRVTCATLSDTYSCIASAIGTLRGPLHGGANEKAFELISSFNSSSDATNGVKNMLKNKEKIMGFGHRVYKTNDPRSKIMKQWSKKLVNGPFGDENLLNISDSIQKLMWDSKKLFPNVDFPAALAYNFCGIPTNLFTPIFVCARTSGWIAHIIEQRSNNKLIRPKGIYIGPSQREYVNIQSRL